MIRGSETNIRRPHQKKKRSEKGKKGAARSTVSTTKTRDAQDELLKQYWGNQQHEEEEFSEKIPSYSIHSAGKKGKMEVTGESEKQPDASSSLLSTALDSNSKKGSTSRYPPLDVYDADSLWLDYDSGGLLDGWSDVDSSDYKMNSDWNDFDGYDDGCNVTERRLLSDVAKNDYQESLDLLEHTASQLISAVGVRDWPVYFSIQGELGVHIKKHKFALLSSLSSEVLNRSSSRLQHEKSRITKKSTTDGFEGCCPSTADVSEVCVKNVLPCSSNEDDRCGVIDSCSVTSSLSSESSDKSREAIHWRNLAVKFISLYQLNRRTEAEEIQRELSELPYESVTTALSKPLFEAVQSTLEVMEFLPEFLSYLAAAGKEKKQQGRKQRGARLGKGNRVVDDSSMLNLEDLLAEFAEMGEHNDSMSPPWITEGSRLPKKKKVLNRVIDLDEVEMHEGQDCTANQKQDDSSDDGWSSLQDEGDD